MIENERLSMKIITANSATEKKPWTKPVIHDLQIKDTFGSREPSPIIEGDTYVIAS